MFTLTGDTISKRWPRIGRYLRVDNATGWVDANYTTWYFTHGRTSQQNEEVAAAYDEWADFFEWDLERRADELAADRTKRHLVEEWTDSMTYCCRRAAEWARGIEPGRWIPQHERRPDLAAERRVIVDGIVARLNTPAKRTNRGVLAMT